MVALYLKAIKKECELLRSVGLSNKKIHERIQRRFKRGLSAHQTSNWRKVCEMVLTNKPLELDENHSVIFYQENDK